MNEIKSLADQLRSKMAQNGGSETPEKPRAKESKPQQPASNSPPKIVQLLNAYDNTDHKSMVHVRFDAQTAQMLTHFKMATGVDITKLVAFSVKKLLEQHPEIREIIKTYFKNLQL